MIRTIMGRLISPFRLIKLKRIAKDESGFLLIETLLMMMLLIVLVGTLVMSFKNTNTLEFSLESSQTLQINEYTKLYKKIAPQIAQSLPIGGTSVISIDSPNYLPYGGIKYINLFEDYTITPQEVAREGISTPLHIYNNLHNKGSLFITRVDINTYTCQVEVDYYNYRNLRQAQYTVDTNLIKTPTNTDKAKYTIGLPLQYQFSFSGKIIPTEIKQ